MSQKSSTKSRSTTVRPAKYKKWLINIFILILALFLMLALGEGAMRWIDGYQLSNVELRQNASGD